MLVLLLAGLVALLIASAVFLSYGFVPVYLAGVIAAFFAIVGMGVRMASRPRAAEVRDKMADSVADQQGR